MGKSTTATGLSLGLAMGLGWSADLRAQDDVPDSAAAAEVESTATAAPTTSGALGVDFASAYFFRGLLQEDQGVIAQPWLELTWSLHEGAGALRRVDLTLGQWNSLHSGPTGSGGTDQAMWYESDFYVALDTTLGDRWHLGAVWSVYHSPSGLFLPAQELAVSLGFDDEGLLGGTVGSGLQPSVVVAFELDGQGDGGSDLGTYGQLGVEPTFALGPLGDLELSLALPVTAGFSLGGYYEGSAGDEPFGFLDVGVAVSSPLPFVPGRLGPWEATLGVHCLLLGDTPEEFDGGDDFEVVVSFGLATSF